MSDRTDVVVTAVEACTRAAHEATGKRPIITLVALAHAFEAWRQSCLRDDRTCELSPEMAAIVAQVDDLMARLRTGYAEAAEAEREAGAFTREADTLARALGNTTPKGDA